MSRPVGDSKHGVTELLHAWNAGDFEARERALTLVYRELRRRAAAHLRRERPGHTLQPTALVHEVYLRLHGQRHAIWEDRSHFLAVISQMMRRVLVDHARERLAAKRSGRWSRLTLDDAEDMETSERQVDVLDLHIALDRLATVDARKSRIAEMRFFGGLSLEEMGRVLEVSPKTVQRDWQLARAWLFKTLTGQRQSRHA
jgi:RNA polymerase sigma factor (TIGR02999 family)